MKKGGRQNKKNGRMVEEELRCNVREEGRRLERNKSRKMGHHEGDTGVVERRREEKRKERKTERL